MEKHRMTHPTWRRGTILQTHAWGPTAWYKSRDSKKWLVRGILSKGQVITSAWPQRSSSTGLPSSASLWFVNKRLPTNELQPPPSLCKLLEQTQNVLMDAACKSRNTKPLWQESAVLLPEAWRAGIYKGQASHPTGQSRVKRGETTTGLSFLLGTPKPLREGRRCKLPAPTGPPFPH